MAKSKKAAIPVPRTYAEAEDVAAKIAEALRAEAAIAASVAKAIEVIKTQTAQQLRAAGDTVKAGFAALEAWAETNRGELLTGDRRSVPVPSGTIGWRLGNPTVEADDEDALLDRCQALGLDYLLSETVALDKNAIKSAGHNVLAQLGDVRIVQRERFYFRPVDADVTREVIVKTGRVVGPSVTS